MAGKAAAPGTAVLLVTANVGSLFDDPENLQRNWLREFYQVVHAHRPHFLALHCQEFGGKNYEASMSHVDKFVKELLSSDAMKEYSRARVYLDENYKSQEQFTALGSFYFLHESLKNIYQFDFKAKTGSNRSVSLTDERTHRLRAIRTWNVFQQQDEMAVKTQTLAEEAQARVPEGSRPVGEGHPQWRPQK